jgi:cytochrome c oxidase assembly protein subunit 15
METATQTRISPWPYRLSVALALVTFPLIWVGGLVTTYDAGMAVPDWPGTYGYNLLRYPWQTWIAGPWDLFIEHGHRLLGATAGLLAISLVVVVLVRERRGSLVVAAFGALGLVIFQGALGGMRVLLDERFLALLHGCVGPIFFAYLAGLIVVTSRRWDRAEELSWPANSKLLRSAWITTGMVYLQLVLGAVMRHVPLGAAPSLFRGALLCHLVLAIGITFHVLTLAVRAACLPIEAKGYRGLGWLVAVLLGIQLLLGLATYVVKYAFPAWLGEFAFAAGYVVQEKSWWQSLIATGHVANGSLILFAATMMSVRATLQFSPREVERTVSRSGNSIASQLILAQWRAA